MIDRRTFLARSSVATALAAVGIQQGAASASLLALPATITPPVEVVDAHVQELEAFTGFWSIYDQVNRCLLANRVELWATYDRCGMTASSVDPDSPAEYIEFEDPKIVWAFTLHDAADAKPGDLSGNGGELTRTITERDSATVPGGATAARSHHLGKSAE